MDLDEATLKAVLEAAGLAGRRVPRGLSDLEEVAGYLGVEKPVLLRGLAAIERLPFLDLDEVMPEDEALHLLPEAIARRVPCLPLFQRGDELLVAVGRVDWRELDEVRHVLEGYLVQFALVDERRLLGLLDLTFPSTAEALVAAFLREGEGEGPPVQRLAEEAPIVEMVEAILQRGALQGASDIHLEPFEHVGRVRFRVDGLITQAFTYPAALHEPLVSRLKILADLRIIERQRPQDGRFSFQAQGQRIDARVSALRVLHGEKLVLRLLRSEQAAAKALDHLGLASGTLARLRQVLTQPHGLILVTGPTGSGKTTTLYAALRHLHDETRNITTLEDPIEYRMFGVNQVPVSPDHDRSFPLALRAVLRQDPDVVMVGEIRDLETAEIALQGALTGHMLLATLHANDTIGAVNRLLDLGVRAANLAPALVAVVAQRLVRRLCECKAEAPMPEAMRSWPGLERLAAARELSAPRGCMSCNFTGYRGRLVLFELLTVDRGLRGEILAGAGSERLREVATERGLEPLLAGGVEAVLAGRTSLEEVMRVVQYEPPIGHERLVSVSPLL